MKEQLDQDKILLSLPLRSFKMQKCYQKEPKFNGVYSKNNLLEIKDRSYVINIDEYKSTGTHG